MLKSPYLLALGLFVASIGTVTSTPAAAQADVALDFSLSQSPTMAETEPKARSNHNMSAPATQVAAGIVEPLPVPSAASRPPIRQAQSLSQLAPPSPIPITVVHSPTIQKPEAPPSDLPKPVGLRFDPGVVARTTTGRNPSQIASPAEGLRKSEDDSWIFQGGSDSLVARTIGSAEGTRAANGDRNRAYYGHIDPGNGVWNLGTFSYQHGARSPEEADTKQLQRLQKQVQTLEQKAAAAGLQLSLVEKLNGLDLANQAPLAALDRGGYIERLAEANRLGMRDREAILWARTRAYIDPDTQRWNAPGLGNNIHSISRDQERRIGAIDAAVGSWQQQSAQSKAQTLPDPAVKPSLPVQPPIALKSDQARRASDQLPLPAALTPTEGKVKLSARMSIARTPSAAAASKAEHKPSEALGASDDLVDQFILQDTPHPFQ